MVVMANRKTEQHDRSVRIRHNPDADKKFLASAFSGNLKDAVDAINEHANPNVCDHMGTPALTIASWEGSEGHVDVVAFIASLGRRMRNNTDENGDTALCVVARRLALHYTHSDGDLHLDADTVHNLLFITALLRINGEDPDFVCGNSLGERTMWDIIGQSPELLAIFGRKQVEDR